MKEKKAIIAQKNKNKSYSLQELKNASYIDLEKILNLEIVKKKHEK